jgi:hypothetical protein
MTPPGRAANLKTLRKARIIGKPGLQGLSLRDELPENPAGRDSNSDLLSLA